MSLFNKAYQVLAIRQHLLHVPGDNEGSGRCDDGRLLLVQTAVEARRCESKRGLRFVLKLRNVIWRQCRICSRLEPFNRLGLEVVCLYDLSKKP